MGIFSDMGLQETVTGPLENLLWLFGYISTSENGRISVGTCLVLILLSLFSVNPDGLKSFRHTHTKNLF